MLNGQAQDKWVSELEPLMNPRSIAILGASQSGGRGTSILRFLLRFGYEGDIYPVNPKYDQVEGFKCYPSLAAIPAPVDFVAIALGAQAALPSLEAAAKKGAKAALIIASGFAETGPEGKELQRQVAAFCRDHGIKLCGPNCYGVFNVHRKMAAYSGSIVDPCRPGGIALILQSGALSHSITEPMSDRGLGFSYMVTTGNEAVVEISDYIRYALEDPNVTHIVSFVEGFKDPAKFVRVADLALQRRKPIILLKVGRSAKGQRATMAHTGSLAGSDAVHDALFRQKGVIRVDDLDELIEAASLFSGGRYPVKPTVAVMSISGGGTSLMSDLSEDFKLSMPDPTPETKAALAQALPVFATPSNPLDMTGAVGEEPEIYPKCIDVFSSEPSIGAIAGVLNVPRGSGTSSSRTYGRHAAVLAEAARRSTKPVVCFTFTSGAFDPEVVRILNEARVPLLMGTRESLKTIKKWADYAEFLRNHEAVPLGPAGERARVTLPPGLLEKSGPLTERESKTLLAAYGIPVTRESLARTADEAVAVARDLGFPVVMKVESPDILHKTEAGGVRLNLATEEQVRQAFAAILDNARSYKPEARIEGVLVQEMARAGTEMIVGVSRDPQFGPVVMVGLGGIFVEVLKDVSLRLPPVSPGDAEQMLSELRGSAILEGVRGRPKADFQAIVDVVVRLSNLARDLGDRVEAIDVNPLLVFPEGQGAKAVDALVILR